MYVKRQLDLLKILRKKILNVWPVLCAVYALTRAEDENA